VQYVVLRHIPGVAAFVGTDEGNVLCFSDSAAQGLAHLPPPDLQVEHGTGDSDVVWYLVNNHPQQLVLRRYVIADDAHTRHTLYAGYAPEIRTWFVQGKPERLQPTMEEWMQGAN